MVERTKLEQQRRDWENMQRRGRLRYGLTCVFVWVGAWTIANDILLIFDRFGWWQQSGLPWNEILVMGVVTGCSQAALHWSDLKRKFRTPPPEEDWMTR
jgi:hypothetical protein